LFDELAESVDEREELPLAGASGTGCSAADSAIQIESVWVLKPASGAS
jgi:hypothetical protein